MDITAFSFSAGDFSGDGRGRFGPDGKLADANFDHLTLGRTRLDAVAVQFTEPQWQIHIGGGVFDAEPFIGKGKLRIGRDAAGQPAAAGRRKALACLYPDRRAAGRRS